MSPFPQVAPLSDPFLTSEGPQGVFRVLLDAMARPGTIGQLPTLDENGPIAAARGLAAIAQTLLDHEVTFAVVAEDDEPSAGDRDAFVAHLRAVTGCRDVLLADANYVFVLGTLPTGLPTLLRTGQPAYPDEGATLVVLVPSFNGSSGTTVRLTGPGVRPNTGATIPGWSPVDFAGLAAANAAPPLGIDVILVDAEGRVMCLPRSTRISAEPSPAPAGDAGRIQEAANGLHRG